MVGRWIASLSLICSASVLSAAELPRPILGRTVTDWQAKDFRGKDWRAAEFQEAPVLVIAVLGTECPLARLYGPRVQQIANDYAERGVRVVAVDANRQDSLAEMQAYARDAGLQIPFLKDARHELVDALGATRTPEVFVLDRDRKIRYCGRIDDQHAVGNRSRTKPEQHDLRAAIDDLLAGRDVAVARTDAVGCLIGREKSVDAAAKVTFAEHIAPLLNARCVECHRTGEIAPFSLTDYEEVAGWAEMIVEVTRERRMPPWHADPKFGHFKNANRLTDDELKLIERWSAAGAPSGDLSKLPPTPTFATGWQLPREPDQIVAMADKPFSVKGEGEVRYQYFTVDPGFQEDKWVSAAEVIPGNRAIVHHVIVFATPKGERVNEDGQLLIAYVPGLRVEPLPKGMAKRVKAGSKLIFQVHYTPNGTPQEDLTKVGLIFSDPKSITHEVQTASTRTTNLRIEPQKDDQQFQSRPATAPRELLLLSMSPHMHLRGKSFRFEATLPNGEKQTLLNVPQYDFNWQTTYRLDEPMVVPQGTRVVAFASFDNSTKNLANPDPNATVTWGDQSWDEMLIGYFDVAIERNSTGNDVIENLRQALVGGAVAGDWIDRLDTNKDGKLQKSELPDRIRDRFELADADGDGAITEPELAKALAKLRGR